MVSSSTPRWSFACSVNIQGEATWYWERVWPPESDQLVSFLLSDSWQVPLTSTSSPVINTAPATWGCCGVPDANHMPAGLVALPAGDSLVTAAWCCNSLCQGLLGAKGTWPCASTAAGEALSGCCCPPRACPIMPDIHPGDFHSPSQRAVILPTPRPSGYNIMFQEGKVTSSRE